MIGLRNDDGDARANTVGTMNFGLMLGINFSEAGVVILVTPVFGKIFDVCFRSHMDSGLFYQGWFDC